jgi:hypothetical protein
VVGAISYERFRAGRGQESPEEGKDAEEADAEDSNTSTLGTSLVTFSFNVPYNFILEKG